MPSLSSELFGSSHQRSAYKSMAETEIDTSGRNNSEILSLKEAINSSAINSNSRNDIAQHHKTATSSSQIGVLPKLDFKRLKKVQEFKDWY